MKKRLGKGKMGVRSILALVSTGTLLAYFLVNLCLSGLLMNQYYVHQIKKQLVEAYHIVETYPDGDSAAMAILEYNNFRVMLVDGETEQVIYNSRVGPPKFVPTAHMLVDNVSCLLEESGGDYTITFEDNPDTGRGGMPMPAGQRLYLAGRTGSVFMEISTELEPLENASDIAVEFNVITGVLVLILTVILYNMLAGKIVRPLEDMTEVADDIARLDFSRRCTEAGGVELNRLAHSINSMSDTMQEYTAQLENANEQLREDLRQLKKSEAARRSLVDNISHDLKTPIALISGYAEGLGSGLAVTPETVREYCGVITDETDRMLEMITRMLTLSRLESGTVELQTEVVSLSDMLDDLVGMFTHMAQTENIALARDYPADCYVVCDYVSVEQVVTNYLQNAMTHLSGQRRVAVTVRPWNELVRLEVFNTAEPISPEVQEHMWDSFYRGESSRRRQGGECGLGLAIVKSNMELMGLPYGMENVEDGVIFWLALPPAEEQPEPEE